MSEILKAIEVPIIAVISGEQSSSTDMTVHTTETSLRISLGNKGLMGLSITLEASIAFSEGLPSLFENEPGIFPTAYNLSSKSTERGKKSIPSLGFSDAVTATCTAVSPYLTRHEPFASWANFPVSTTNSLPANWVLNVLWFSNIKFLQKIIKIQLKQSNINYITFDKK